MSDTTREPALEVNDLAKSFGSLRALEGVSFSVRPGSIFGLLGPNGSGKTTLLRILLGMLRADQGTVRFRFSSAPGPLRDKISYLPEERGLYQKAPVSKLLGYFGALKGASPIEARARAEEWLARFGLSRWSEERVETLSKGMQQLVQFTLALVNDPELVILDEPFSGLDPLGVKKLEDSLAELRSRGKTLLLATHQLSRAEALCDDILLLDRGRPLACDRLNALLSRHAEPVVAVSRDYRPDGFRGIDRIVPNGERTLVYLSAGATPLDFLNHAHRHGIELGQYTVSYARLEDIFLKLVSENRGPSR